MPSSSQWIASLSVTVGLLCLWELRPRSFSAAVEPAPRELWGAWKINDSPSGGGGGAGEKYTKLPPLVLLAFAARSPASTCRDTSFAFVREFYIPSAGELLPGETENTPVEQDASHRLWEIVTAVTATMVNNRCGKIVLVVEDPAFATTPLLFSTSPPAGQPGSSGGGGGGAKLSPSAAAAAAAAAAADAAIFGPSDASEAEGANYSARSNYGNRNDEKPYDGPHTGSKKGGNGRRRRRRRNRRLGGLGGQSPSGETPMGATIVEILADFGVEVEVYWSPGGVSYSRLLLGAQLATGTPAAAAATQAATATAASFKSRTVPPAFVLSTADVIISPLERLRAACDRAFSAENPQLLVVSRREPEGRSCHSYAEEGSWDVFAGPSSLLTADAIANTMFPPSYWGVENVVAHQLSPNRYDAFNLCGYVDVMHLHSQRSLGKDKARVRINNLANTIDVSTPNIYEVCDMGAVDALRIPADRNLRERAAASFRL